MKFSFTGLSNFSFCPKKYYYAQVKKLYSSNQSLQIKTGQEIHEFLANNTTKKHKEEIQALGKKILYSFPNNLKMEHTEYKIEGRINNCFDFIGYADAIATDKNGNKIIVEYKTTGSRFVDWRKYSLSYQLPLYFQVLKKTDPKIIGFVFVVLYNLQTKKKKKEQKEDFIERMVTESKIEIRTYDPEITFKNDLGINKKIFKESICWSCKTANRIMATDQLDETTYELNTNNCFFGGTPCDYLDLCSDLELVTSNKYLQKLSGRK